MSGISLRPKKWAGTTRRGRGQTPPKDDGRTDRFFSAYSQLKNLTFDREIMKQILVKKPIEIAIKSRHFRHFLCKFL